MAPACLRTNHKFVVTVCVPKASSTRRPHPKEELQRELQLCDLPADLVSNIVEGLSSADRIRFGATCKNNISLVTTKNHHQYQLREIDKLPWLATFTRTNLSLDFSLFEPLHVRGQPNYATYNIKDPNGKGFGGWTKAILKASNKGKIKISTLDQTSKQWKTKVFKNLLYYVSSVVYNEGCFYCLSSMGQLLAYDVVHQSLELVISWDSSPISYLSSVLSDDVRKYMVVCEGKLIVAVMDNKPLNYKVEMNSCALFEFSLSTRTFVKITSLGNHALFLGQSSFSVHVSDPSSPINIAERAYFYSYNCGNGKCNLFYYSFKDGQCHAAKGSGYWSSDVQRGIWIEPPCLTSSPSGFACLKN